MTDNVCDECESQLKEIGKYKNTRKFICPECFTEKVMFVANKECEHEYDEKSKNICIQCGKPSIHYG